MPKGYVTATCMPQPFSLVRGGTAAASLNIIKPVVLFWSDGSVDAYQDNGAASIVRTTSGATTFDTTLYVWLVMAIKGTGAPVLAMEKDVATFSTLLPGTWAALQRIAGPSIGPMPQS